MWSERDRSNIELYIANTEELSFADNPSPQLEKRHDNFIEHNTEVYSILILDEVLEDSLLHHKQQNTFNLIHTIKKREWWFHKNVYLHFGGWILFVFLGLGKVL